MLGGSIAARLGLALALIAGDLSGCSLAMAELARMWRRVQRLADADACTCGDGRAGEVVPVAQRFKRHTEAIGDRDQRVAFASAIDLRMIGGGRRKRYGDDQ